LPANSDNSCLISAVQKAPDGNKLVVMSVIDNLVKGASGQAIQNMNQLNIDNSLGQQPTVRHFSQRQSPLLWTYHQK
jgi:N-acetyl-gamma-glutamylphosphate reductase